MALKIIELIINFIKVLTLGAGCKNWQLYNGCLLSNISGTQFRLINAKSLDISSSFCKLSYKMMATIIAYSAPNICERVASLIPYNHIML